jgi:hypothetical protein
MSYGATTVDALEDLNDDQRDDYADLVSQAARMVADGIAPIEETTPEPCLDDDQEPTEAFIEEFREAVVETVEERDDSHTAARSHSPSGSSDDETRWRPEEVDFTTIWHEYDFSMGVSDTQLTEALAVSDHTRFGKAGARKAIEQGIDRGAIRNIPRSLPDGMQLTGVLYGRGEGA